MTTIQGWALPDGCQVGEVVDDPPHLVITVNESMIGDRIEVWGQVHYQRTNGHGAMWYPNAASIAKILQDPGLRRMVARLLGRWSNG